MIGFLVSEGRGMIHFAEIVDFDIDCFEPEWSVFFGPVLKWLARPVLNHLGLDFSVYGQIRMGRSELSFCHFALDLIVE